MRLRGVQLAIYLVLLSGHAFAGVSSWDELQLGLLRQYSTPLRWDNVEGAPEWVLGPKPHLRWGQRRHLIRLRPGEEVIVRGPVNSWLRVVGEDTPLHPKHLRISLSIDGRAFAETTAIESTEPHCLLVKMPEDKPAMVRLARPVHADSDVVLAAYFSREQPFETLAPYLASVRLPGKRARLRRDDEAASIPALLLSSGKSIELTVHGPTRLEVVAHLDWPTTEALREQSSIVEVRLDDGGPMALLFSPELDQRHRTRVSHSIRLVSSSMRGFFVVPEGRHHLRVQSSSPVYLSVFAQPRAQFLLPWINAPDPDAKQILKPAFVIGLSASPFELPSALLKDDDFVGREQNAFELGTDNAPLDSGAQAADWLKRVARTRPDYPAARLDAETLWRERTFYREIGPISMTTPQPLSQALFAPVHLRDVFEPQRPVAVFNPTLEQVCGSMAQGGFAEIAPSQGLEYELPARSFDGQLRIAALAPGNARVQFFVQFDKETPLQMLLDPAAVLSNHELEPSAALATLQVIQRASPALGLPADRFDLPLPVVAPGIIELPLPERVRRVRIFQEAQGTHLAVSVAYRAARPFELGEAGYLALLDRCDRAAAFKLLSDPETSARDLPESLRWLHDQYLPMIRLLRAHSNDFTKSIDSSALQRSKIAPLSKAELAELAVAARNLEKSGRLIDALEVWNKVFWAAPDAREPTLAIMRDLKELGEDFLAGQYARVALLAGPRGQIPQEAVTLLENTAHETDDPDQLEQLRTIVFLRCPCARHLADLVDALGANSSDEMALMAGWLLPPEQRRPEAMLAAALHLNWWQTFDRLLNDLPTVEAKEFWAAQKELAFFHFAEAERHLHNAGSKVAEISEALRQGRQIRAQLSAAALSDRFEGLLAWEQWLAHQPGPSAWQDAPELVCEAAGTESLFDCELNHFISFFRSEPGKPVKLRFLGPARLQLEARPELDAPFQKPVDDWLEMVEYGLTNRVPICQCIPNPGLRFSGRTNALAGVKTLTDDSWGPGLHEMEIRLCDRPGLIRVRIQRPVLPLHILPPLTPERMDLVLRAGSKSPTNNASDGFLQALRRNGIQSSREVAWVSPNLARPNTRLVMSKPLETTGLTPTQILRLALRMPAGTATAPDFDARELQALPIQEQWLAACRWKRWSDFHAWGDLPDRDLTSYRLATGQIGPVLHSNAPGDPLKRLMALLQVSEFAPAWREEAQCLAELLSSQTNCPSGFRTVLARTTQKRTWDPLAISPASAGVQALKLRSDWAQDPSLRIRRALLAPGPTNQFTISDQSVYTAAMSLQHPAAVHVRVEIAKAGFSPLVPLTLSLQMDALEARHLSLGPSSPAVQRNFDLPTGPHLLRMWIEDPVANQCVRIALSGAAGTLTNTIWSEPFADIASEKRFFFGATSNQPVQFSWTGPALLRIDEWHEGALSSQYRYVPAGDQQIALTPSPGRTESWFQVFVRGTQTNQPDKRLAWSIREPEEVPPPRLSLPQTAALPKPELRDYYHLGGQENGTWSLRALLARRTPFEPLSKKNTVLNEFAQGTVAYRKAAPSDTLWFDTEALGRVHRPGDVTLGLSEYIEGHPRLLPVEWAWSGDAFLGTLGPQQSDTEGALDTTLELGQRRHLSRKLDWYPFAGLFAHYLSLHPSGAKSLTYIDQDLYTPYRHDHLWGGALGSSLEYQPWLDTTLKGTVQLTSNENFSPDHWGMAFSWDQFCGPFRAEVSYLFTQWLVDANRKSSSLLQGVAAGVYGELWLNGCHRLELGGQFRHDWPGLGNSYFLVISWDFSQGRGYRDFSPHKTKFLDLRTRRIPAGFNNSFGPE